MNKTIKQVKYILQEKIISLILLHYIRKLKEAQIQTKIFHFFVNLIYFLGTVGKIATTAFLRVETITHFYRQIFQNSLLHY